MADILAISFELIGIKIKPESERTAFFNKMIDLAKNEVDQTGKPLLGESAFGMIVPEGEAEDASPKLALALVACALELAHAENIKLRIGIEKKGNGRAVLKEGLMTYVTGAQCVRNAARNSQVLIGVSVRKLLGDGVVEFESKSGKRFSATFSERHSILDINNNVRTVHVAEIISSNQLISLPVGSSPISNVPEKYKAAMEAYYLAIFHGCAAGRYDDAFRYIYMKMMRRGEDKSNIRILGDVDGDLKAIQCFIDQQTEEPFAGLSQENQAALYFAWGYSLRIKGCLGESIRRMKTALNAYTCLAEASREQRTFMALARVAGTLSQTKLLVGQTKESIEIAQTGVDAARTSSDEYQIMSKRVALADALAQRGDVRMAKQYFEEAEKDYGKPLSRLQGFLYCDFLLRYGKDRLDEVRRRANEALEQNDKGDLLDRALDNLSLGRAAFKKNAADSAAKSRLDEAVTLLEHAKQEQYLPRGLLARAEYHRENQKWAEAEADLKKAETIASADKCHMKLYTLDIAIEWAFLAAANNNNDEVRRQHEKALKLIEDTGLNSRIAVLRKLGI